jgi:membrane protein YdbS with pleckstrin-like domain
MKTIKKVAAVIGLGLIAASIVGNTLHFQNNHAFLMFGVVILLTLVLPLHIITTSNYDKIRDRVIKNAERQQGYHNKTVSVKGH